jgi:hypothetical protein
MRHEIGLLLALAVGAGHGGATRYGIAPDLQSYPQGTPQEGLASVLKAVGAGRFDYLVAQLADPAFVDDRVKRVYGGRFEQQVEDTRVRLDPLAVKLLGRFLKEGTWTVTKTEARADLEDVPDRAVYLRRRDGRWFLEHRNRPPGGRKGKPR